MRHCDRDGDTSADYHDLQGAQRNSNLKKETDIGSSSTVAAQDTIRSHSPPLQRRSILSRNQTFPAAISSSSARASLRPGISRLASAPTKKASVFEDADDGPRYTSLSELVAASSNLPFCRSDSFGHGSRPRTPLKDALVEKAVRAYLQPSQSFNNRSRASARWGSGTCLVLKQFLPSFLTRVSLSLPNPFRLFCCAVHAFGLYVTRRTAPVPVCFQGGCD